MKDKGLWITLIVGFVIAFAFIGNLISNNLSNPHLIPLLIGMPIFIVLMLFAVFGRDLFKRNTKLKDGRTT